MVARSKWPDPGGERALMARAQADSTGRRPRIVSIGGGTGLPVVLSGLSALVGEIPAGPATEAPAIEQLTAIVTVTDDGGSSGRLRRDLGILPPGDVRNCLAALAGASPALTELLQHRLSAPNALDGHPVGNLLLAALTQITGDFITAVDRLSGILKLRGRVLPSTRENVTLRAELDGGDLVEGETAIASKRAPIKRLWLERLVAPLPDALRAIVNADGIVVGPGSLYTSILPNLLVGGVASTIFGVNAVRIYVANLMTEPGETDGFTLNDHLRVIREHVGLDLFDYVLVNRRTLQPEVAREYAARGALPVEREEVLSAGGIARVVERDLAWNLEGGKIRHAPGDLARAILELVEQGRPRDRRRWADPKPSNPENLRTLEP